VAVAAPARAAKVADAGGLQARVKANPWALTLADAAGHPILAERAGADESAVGRLGFRTALGWEHVTRVIEGKPTGKGGLAQLATSDPQRTMRINLRRESGGVIGLSARVFGGGAAIEGIGIAFDGDAGERYLGFGERSDAASRTEGEVENYVADGPYQDNEYSAIGLFAPAWGLRDARPDATYYPVPWLLATAGYGVLVGNDETSYFRLGDAGDGSWSVEVVAAPPGETGAAGAPPVDRLRLEFFAGPRPAAALRRMTRDTGRQPRPGAKWVLGPWFQARGDEQAQLAALREADAPVSALQTYLHYLPCGDQVGAGDQQERVLAAHAAGVAITTYFNPMICNDYQPAYGQAAAAGALTADATGQPYVYRYGADADQAFFVSQFDFFTEAGFEHYRQLLDEALGARYDGWMEDFGEYTPLDSVSAGAIHGSRAHNRYAERYHCAAHRATRTDPSIVRYQRSGWTGAARCADVVWGGDPTTAWGFDGLRSAVTQALSAGSSGIGIWGSDVGGFFALGSNRLTPELLTRWVQLGAVSTVMRTQANGVSVPPQSDRPQVLDPGQVANWRRYTKLHTQLYPYLAAALDAYRRRGIPPMRQLALAYPADSRAVAAEDEFLFGPDLLAAPVLEPGATTRSLYLPAGRWVDLWRSAVYREGPGAIALRRARTMRGGRSVTVPAPLDELPLFVRAGAVLPLLPADVDTLAGFREDVPGVVRWAERRDRMQLLAFPRGATSAAFMRGERLRSHEGDGAWRLAVDGARSRKYALAATLRTLDSPFTPCEVSVDGAALGPGDWSFDRSTGVLTARFAGRSPVLEARACA
jgi:alpha-glucosidase (family GH31 glycosyl hydrolase)